MFGFHILHRKIPIRVVRIVCSQERGVSVQVGWKILFDKSDGFSPSDAVFGYLKKEIDEMKTDMY